VCVCVASMLSFTIHCMTGLLTDFTLFIEGVCGVKCRVCVALTVLGWSALSRVSVCRGCSGLLTV
jgi:hypothetical protein